MAGLDLNEDPAPVETRGRRPRDADRRSGRLWRRKGPGAIIGTIKRTNALWFFTALFGGGVAIWWAKSAANAWFAATVAAGTVLALAIYHILNDEDAREEEGDNVYYLGLLFTLLSLMFTLMELFGADADPVRNA